ncbi:bacteriohemerythrin [Desulfobacterales bacterium HSG16]|nr:bacteriohemerythrin [Desulfobacterales bacterium HSG16]
MKIEWQSDFETGNEAVDLQHRFFVDLINRIGNSFKESTDEDYKRKLIVELKKYAEFHFASEENIAKSLKLPGIANHHERHMELIDEFNDNADELEKGNKSFDDFIQFLTEWFTGHTFYEDQKLFQYPFFKP